MASSTTQEAPQSTMLVLTVCLCRVCVSMCYVLLFLLYSQDDTNKSEVMKLKRRFLKDRTGESTFFAKKETCSTGELIQLSGSIV